MDELSKPQLFLEEYRCCCGKDPLIRKNEKFRRMVEKCNISDTEILQILLSKLTKEHYYRGPEEDERKDINSGVIYIFKYPWENYKLYIKLKIPKNPKERLNSTICLSFHLTGDI